MVYTGIAQGDVVKVVCDASVQDGDIVLASIDDESTIKSYCVDSDGQAWLVPQNDDYEPIPLGDRTNVRIIGRVKEIIKKAPRVSYRDCMKLIRKAKQKKFEPNVISQEQVSAAIRAIAPEVKVARQWYAVYRAFVDKLVLKAEDFDGFCAMVIREVPEHEHLPVADELQRLSVQSFRKAVKKWDPMDAPVKGKRFQSYQSIGLKTIAFLETS